MQRRKKYTKEQMYALIRNWESGGVSQEVFYKQHGIAKSTFAYWRKKYLNETGKDKNKSKFIPVQIARTNYEEGSAGVLELVYPNGIRLVCSEDMELSRLKPLILL